ncbi:hypothetical protein S245_052718, partial [Arachis hypogaea]
TSITPITNIPSIGTFIGTNPSSGTTGIGIGTGTTPYSTIPVLGGIDSGGMGPSRSGMNDESHSGLNPNYPVKLKPNHANPNPPSLSFPRRFCGRLRCRRLVPLLPFFRQICSPSPPALCVVRICCCCSTSVLPPSPASAVAATNNSSKKNNAEQLFLLYCGCCSGSGPKATMSVIQKFFIASMFMLAVPVAILYGFNNNLFPGTDNLSPYSVTLVSGFLAVISVNVVIAFYIYLAMREPAENHEPDPKFLAEAKASMKQPTTDAPQSSDSQKKEQ